MHTKKVGLATVLALVLALPASAGAKTLIGSGSSVAQPYMQALFAGYHKVNPRVQFLYTANGGNAGVKDVQAGRSQFAVNTRPPLPSDAGTTYVKLFLDGLCVYVNSSNKLANLSIGELSDIFTGVRTRSDFAFSITRGLLSSPKSSSRSRRGPPGLKRKRSPIDRRPYS